MVTKEQFNAYVKAQKSGMTNMFDIRMVCRLSGLKRETVLEIQENYENLMKNSGAES